MRGKIQYSIKKITLIFMYLDDIIDVLNNEEENKNGKRRQGSCN